MNACCYSRTLRSNLPKYLAVISLSIAMCSAPAFAYRPFDGTDAAVAEPGELEIELQPAGLLLQGPDRTLIAPATVLNVGLTKGWELVLEGQGQTPLSPSGRSSLAGAGAFLKTVLVPGSLQGAAGPSVATEFGMLLPGVNAQSGTGASIAGIVSQRWEWTTVHFNVAAAFTREHRADLFVGTIIEGPLKWPIRPVAEIFYENEFGAAQTVSGLIGAIWQVRDNLTFDVGVRHSLTNGHAANEVRAGLTFGFPLRMLGGQKAK